MFNLKQLFKKQENKSVFTCSCCGKIYDEMPLCFGGDYPAYYYKIPDSERESKIEMSESLCIIDGYYFHRGRLTIPITDHSTDLVFNVWTTISQANFEIRNEIWNDPERVNHDPYFGYLQNIIPTYDDTLGLKIGALENEVGFIPTIEVIDEEHSLFHDQQNGITFEQASQKVQIILKDWHQD